MNTKTPSLKSQFPLLKHPIRGKHVIYLDNAATTQKPQKVIDAITTYYSRQNANIHRGVYALSEEATTLYEKSHETIANFIGADKEEIIFTSGTTMSLNMLAYCLPALFANKKEIVLTQIEHHANLVPWQQVAKVHGLTIKFIPVQKDFTLDYDAARKLITQKTAVVSFCHISNALGTVNDAKLLCDLARKNGAFSVVDAAQSIAHMAINVQDMGCDFLAFSGHKMYGPTGIGVLFGKKELLLKMQPFLTGGDMIKKVSLTDAQWNDLPMKFEAGTPHIEGAIGLGAAIDFINQLGLPTVAAHEKDLMQYAYQQLKKVSGITFYSPDIKNGSGIISFNIDGIHTHDLSSVLSDEGVCVRGGHHCAMPLMELLDIPGTCRMSVAVYNTKEDIDQLVKALNETINVFKGRKKGRAKKR